MSGLRRALLMGAARALAWASERLAAAAEPLSTLSPPPPRRRPSQVLVVDDDLGHQRAAIALLAALDLRATVASGGDEALGMLRGLRFDLILLDCDMPAMDGPDTARAIRGGAAGPASAGLPIIGMALHVGQRGPHALLAGMNRVLAKPLNSTELEAAIRDVLAMGAPAPAAIADPATEDVAVAPPVPAGPPPVFDPAYLLRDFGEERELARQIVAATRSELPRRLGQMGKAAAAADWEKARHLAGIMAAQAGQIGGLRLAARLGDTESALAAGGRLDAAALMALRAAIGELDDALRGWG